MKMPKLFQPKKKLRASTARRSMNRPEEMDYEEMAEPNMKLSRALLIVLVLHIVAVAGIVAFNTIKSRQSAIPPKSAAVASALEKPAPDAKADTAATNASSEARPAVPVTSSAREPEEPARALPVSAPADGKVYVVIKGDNPVSIARKHKVSESELLRINNIDDPRKLQIGQKLIIPSARKTKK